jgi:transposase
MGQKQQHEVRLTEEQRNFLIEKTSSGNWAARKIKRAQMLLKADKNQKNPMEDLAIAKDLHCCRFTISLLRKRFGREGLGCLDDKTRAGRPKKFDGDVEAHVTKIACSSPPDGRERWTLRLIADRIVTLTEVETCSHTSIGNILKKTNLSLG